MKKFLKVLVNIVIWLFVAFAACVTIVVFTGSSNDGVGNLFGYIPLTVQTQSMEPTIMTGDVVIGTKVDYKTLKKGDIITYWTTETDAETKKDVKVLNTHRIVKVKNTGKGKVWSFETKGDNNRVKDDGEVSAGDVVAKYKTKINGLGKAVDYLNTQKGFFICILLPLILFFLYQLYHFIKVIVTVKGNGGALSDEEEAELKEKAVAEYLAKQQKAEAKQAAKEAKVETLEASEETVDASEDNSEK